VLISQLWPEGHADADTQACKVVEVEVADLSVVEALEAAGVPAGGVSPSKAPVGGVPTA
jgi:hypothetical protein